MVSPTPTPALVAPTPPPPARPSPYTHLPPALVLKVPPTPQTPKFQRLKGGAVLCSPGPTCLGLALTLCTRVLAHVLEPILGEQRAVCLSCSSIPTAEEAAGFRKCSMNP